MGRGHRRRQPRPSRGDDVTPHQGRRQGRAGNSGGRREQHKDGKGGLADPLRHERPEPPRLENMASSSTGRQMYPRSGDRGSCGATVIDSD